MKIHSSLFAILALALTACGHQQPEEQPVLASRAADSVKADWLKPHEAILRIRLEAEEPTMIVKMLSIDITNEGTFQLQSQVDQMMTHPVHRDYVL